MNYEILLVICIIFIVMIIGVCSLCSCCFIYDPDTIFRFYEQPLPPRIDLQEDEIV